MRNYPLFKNDKKASTYKNWQNTYVESLKLHYKSLVDYSNYFLADYRLTKNIVRLTDRTIDGITYPCYSLKNLKYHQYVAVSEKSVFVLGDDYEDLDYRIIDKNRYIYDNNMISADKTTTKTWDNFFIQSWGYAGFYVNRFEDGKMIFEFKKAGEVSFGTSPDFSNLTFNTRYFLSSESLGIISINSFSKTIQNKVEGEGAIIDKQGHIWNDTEHNPIMTFVYKRDNLIGSIGEEVIADTSFHTSTKVDEVSIADYTITVKNQEDLERYWPNHCHIYVI